jgi:hypothetical protein
LYPGIEIGAFKHHIKGLERSARPGGGPSAGSLTFQKPTRRTDMKPRKITHEAFIAKVAKIAISQLKNKSERDLLNNIKLVYGAGPDGVRGVTYYSRWQNGDPEAHPFVEISAFNQESPVQIMGTTIHELGHVLAGWGAGHGPKWHEACKKLGLVNILAGGTEYDLDKHFEPKIRAKLQKLEIPNDGQPKSLAAQFAVPGAPAMVFKLKPCGAGIGTKGGKSRGKGSGSRLRLFECECEPPIKVRLARDEFNATCNCCHHGFMRH